MAFGISFLLNPEVAYGAAKDAALNIINAFNQTFASNPPQITYTVSQQQSGQHATDRQGVQDNAIAGQQEAENESRSRQFASDIFKMLTGQQVKLDDETKKELKIMGAVQQGIHTASNMTQNLMKQSLGFVEDIYMYLKRSSPLLQSIETLFNLAMMLFFMPLGNAIAEEMIPAVIDLVDNVVNMWDAFEGKTLSQIMSTMMTEGVKLFAGFFREIGASLAEEQGLLGAVGNMILAIANFLEGPAAAVFNLIVSVITIVITHIKELISLIVAFYAMEYTLGVAQMYVTATSNAFFGMGAFAGLGIATAAVAGSALVGVGAGMATYTGLTALGLASGGYVPSKPGGTLTLLGEGGEGEYVIPESKIHGVNRAGFYSSSEGGLASGGDNITLNFYGYTGDDIEKKVRDVISHEVSISRIRSGF